MARMIPPTVHSTVRSGAERRLFGIIRDTQGSEDWACLHSLALARHESKRRGEIDFLIVCPLGVFALEVKGGRVARRNGVWLFTDRFDNSHQSNEGPFDQAAGAMFSLERQLRSHFAGTPIAEVLCGYGVVFPDVEFSSVGCESDPALVYDRRDRGRSFVAYVQRLATFARDRDQRKRRGLTAEQIRDIAEFLRSDFDLVPPMSVVIGDTRQALASLTREQGSILGALEDSPRVIIDGPAGCGKSLLAAEAARRAARKGLRVLLLCYNRMLATHMRVAVDKERYPGSVEVRTIHSCFAHLIEHSSLREEFESRRAEESSQRVFDELYPEYAALAALEAAAPLVDVLIIDEAQDVLTSRNVAALSEIVRGGIDGGTWRLFMDSNNQACVYGKLDSGVVDHLRTLSVSHLLTLNCRNTKPIALQTNVVAAPSRRTEGRVDGPPVEYLCYQGATDCWTKLTRVLNDLHADGVGAGSITILIAQSPDDVGLEALRACGARELTETEVPILGTDRLTSPTWATASAFKGLENDVIVIAGLEDVEAPWWRAICYVAMSRARMRLIALIDARCDDVRKVRLQKELETQLSSPEVFA